jgi:hypothetical protein
MANGPATGGNIYLKQETLLGIDSIQKQVKYQEFSRTVKDSRFFCCLTGLVNSSIMKGFCEYFTCKNNILCINTFDSE